MLAENNPTNKKQFPNINVNRKQIVLTILHTIKTSIPNFKSYIATQVQSRELNEDELTQILVEQIEIQIRMSDFPFSVNSQFRDIYEGSSGVSDFYFHPIEEGKSTQSIFSVESKRLPAPTKDREKEYVIGTINKNTGKKRKNGGIERYKLEIHGKGLPECGLIGFIENENYIHWKSRINNWIIDLATKEQLWKEDEILTEREQNKDYIYLLSHAHSINSRDLLLHHIWI